MSVDLSALEIGDEVDLFCGLRLKVKSIKPMTLERGAVTLEWDAGYAAQTYHRNGQGWASADNDFDRITAIHKKPFDWNEVKPGDQFFYTNSNALGRLTFVAMHPTRKGVAVCINEAAHDKHPRNVSLDDMERAQEHDIEV